MISFEINNTKYNLVIGLVNNRWTIKLLRGIKVIGSYIIEDGEYNKLLEKVVFWILDKIHLDSSLYYNTIKNLIEPLLEGLLVSKPKVEESIIFQGRDSSIYKVIVIGDPEVNKSMLFTKFIGERFEERYLPVLGVSITMESINLEDIDTTVDIMFWDIDGRSNFYMLHRPYFNNADGIILVFDITKDSSFNNMNNWWQTCINFGLSEIPRILVGVKDNLLISEREITPSMAMHLSESLNAPYFETSTLNGDNIKKIFHKMAELIYRRELIQK